MLPPRDVLDAQQSKKFQVLNPGSLATSFIQVNLGSPDVSDVRVRQALAYALDRVTLNKALNRGLYKIANTPFGTGLFPHEQVDGYPGYDPAKARKLVEDYGKPIKVKLSINASPASTLAGAGAAADVEEGRHRDRDHPDGTGAAGPHRGSRATTS